MTSFPDIKSLSSLLLPETWKLLNLQRHQPIRRETRKCETSVCPLMVSSTHCSFKVSIQKKLKQTEELLSGMEEVFCSNSTFLLLKDIFGKSEAEILLNLHHSSSEQFSAVLWRSNLVLTANIWKSWVGSVSTGWFVLNEGRIDRSDWSDTCRRSSCSVQ